MRTVQKRRGKCAIVGGTGSQLSTEKRRGDLLRLDAEDEADRLLAGRFAIECRCTRSWDLAISTWMTDCKPNEWRRE